MLVPGVILELGSAFTGFGNVHPHLCEDSDMF